MKKILIKIGSNSVVGKYEMLHKNLSNLIKETCLLKEKYQICIVISGAKASYPRYEKIFNDDSLCQHKTKAEIFSAGQVFLTTTLYKICSKNNKILSFILISDSDMRENKTNICHKIETIMKSQDSILFINCNDTVCTDNHILNNDYLAKELNDAIKFDFVFFLSSIEGVLDVARKVIKNLNNNTMKKVVFFKKTDVGTGGMEEKIVNCKLISEKGSKCYIISAFKKNIISRILDGKKIGTFIDF